MLSRYLTVVVASALILLPAFVFAVDSPLVSDTTPPTVTGGFTINSIQNNLATLTWTVPSDNVGVTRYEIRGKASPTGAMIEADWSAATILAVPPPPTTAPATLQSFLLQGLTQSTFYAIALKAFDAAGNGSPIASLLFTTTGPANSSPAQTAPVVVTPTPSPVFTPTPVPVSLNGSLLSGTANLIITVRAPNGSPLAGATLELNTCAANTAPGNICLTASGTTDSKGNYIFSGIASGIYTLSSSGGVNHPEFGPISIKLVLFGGGTASQDLILPFAPIVVAPLPPVLPVVPQPVAPIEPALPPASTPVPAPSPVLKFSPTCNAKLLPPLRVTLKQVSKQLTSLATQIKKLKKTGSVPANFDVLNGNTQAFLKTIINSASCQDVYDMFSNLTDSLKQIQASLAGSAKLGKQSQILKSFDAQFKTLVKQVQTATAKIRPLK